MGTALRSSYKNPAEHKLLHAIDHKQAQNKRADTIVGMRHKE